MNIMIITQSLSGGGAEKLAANLSLGLSGKMNVYIVTYWENDKEYEYAGNRINLDLLGKNRIERIIIACKRIRAIRDLKKKYQIDCSISYIPPCDYVNVFSRIKGEKIVIDVVSNMSTVYPKGLKKFFRKKVLEKADFLITVSEGVRQDIINNFGICEDKTETIYNSCDIRAIQRECNNKVSTKVKYGLPEKYISSMGSFRFAKGHWHLIKAFYTIKDQIPNYKLVICGDGIYREMYQELINSLGMKDRVLLPGFINPPHSIIAGSALFVFSSVFEGFGNAIVEAMAAGVPIISTDCKYGPREILAPGSNLNLTSQNIEECENGILVPPFSLASIDISTSISKQEKMMGKAILDLLIDEKKSTHYILKGLEYCKKFENSYITSKWVEKLEKLTNGE